MRGFAICSLIARRVAACATLPFPEILFAMLDDRILPDLGTVNPIHTGWNIPDTAATGRTALVEFQSFRGKASSKASISSNSLTCWVRFPRRCWKHWYFAKSDTPSLFLALTATAQCCPATSGWAVTLAWQFRAVDQSSR